MSHAANVYLKAVAADSRPHNHVKKPEIERKKITFIKGGAMSVARLSARAMQKILGESLVK